MKKLIFRCGLAPGDIVMLTAAVRDLHRCYPGKYVTDVRTLCPAFWEHNPFVTSLCADDPDVEQIDCSYPLINKCNGTPYHCLHGFIEFLNDRLHLAIKPTAFKGDIHISEQEKAWYSQVHELTKQEIPFWLVAAGGKYDVTIKWWDTGRYQQVVDHFRGRIQFVQIGEAGHHHRKLDGVIDLRGQTDLRELIRLVYHSQGVLCSITALMHLAAAVQTKRREPPNRPCVVIAGGREPAHWEAYPDHQVLHTNGALPCCSAGGCWKDRTMRLRDGDPRDRIGNLCTDMRNGLPHCMEMISAEDVVRRITMYFEGGSIKYLTGDQRAAAKRGMIRNKDIGYDQQPLNLHSAGMACDGFIRQIPDYPDRYKGQGIVICGGGLKYLTNAWVCINSLRQLNCRLPIQLWYLGAREKDQKMETLLAPLDVTCVDAFQMRRQFPVRMLGGWGLKAYAMLHCRFREVLLLDADNVPVRNPAFLFATKEFQATGALFWPDYDNPNGRKAVPVWRSCGLRRPREPEFETGQILVDKARTWRALCLALWFNENSDFYYQYLHGDKETFHLAFRKLNTPYSLVPKRIRPLAGTMCQHDFEGRRLFQHRNTDKWDFLLHNRKVPGFWHEGRCREYVQQLQRKWDGGMDAFMRGRPLATWSKNRNHLRIQAVMISCPERLLVRQQTIANLARTDWPDIPLQIELDSSVDPDLKQRQTACALEALKQGIDGKADYIFFLEDDLGFNRYLKHNLLTWKPLRRGAVTLAGLYNPGLREAACDFKTKARLVVPTAIFGSQAFLISRSATEYIVRNWNRVAGMQDIRISRLAGRLRKPIFYHAPSLVQHVGTESVWGGKFHQAVDFDRNWKA